MTDGLDRIASLARRRGLIAPAVLDVLESQNRGWGASPHRRAHLDALRQGAAVVVTGQQLGLCLGPLYTVYKAASAVRLSRDLQAAGVPAVPVFWLQAEDHDFEEIRTVRWSGPDGEREASLPARPAARARTSIAHERVGPGIAPVLEALAADLGDSEEGRAFLARVRRHYRPEASMPEAFGGLLAELFEPFGLLTLQPRDAALAPLGAELHRRVIDEHEALAGELLDAAARLQTSGGRPPVPIRADCALSFFHPDGPEGPRYRLVPGAGGFGLSGAPAHFARAALMRRLEEAPLEFSTSALLRPVLQDQLLPTAATIGGPAEVAYAAQLGPLYERLGLVMAPFVRRASFVVTTVDDRRDLVELSLSREDLAEREDELARRLGHGPVSTSLRTLAGSVRVALEGLHADLRAIDPGLEKTAARTGATIGEALAKLRGRAERAVAARHPDRLRRLRRLRSALRPGGAPQERILGLPAVARLGTARVVAEAVERASIGGPGAEVELAL